MLIYQGPNYSNTGNIAVIATGMDKPSANRKTGDMIQIWILNADVAPVEAQQTGEDSVVCGDCKLRPANGGGCYVNVGHAPGAIWRKFRAGGYKATGYYEMFQKPVRIGAYGDVAEIPKRILEYLMGQCAKGHTCYTHMWKTRPDLQDIAMASVETLEDYQTARMSGWSTFRVIENEWSLLEPDELLCLNQLKGIQCRDCKLCKGNPPLQIGIVIEAHGPQKRKVHA